MFSRPSPSLNNLLVLRRAIQGHSQAPALFLLVVRDLCLTPQPPSPHVCRRKLGLRKGGQEALMWGKDGESILFVLTLI